jgi:arabinose-5-phosphate isomerase
MPNFEALTPQATTSPSRLGGALGVNKAQSASEIVQDFCRVLNLEQRALELACERLRMQPEAIDAACHILANRGITGAKRVVTSGIGKAGLIAGKVAATLSSTGTAATFIHPVEAMHGDVGFVRPGDAALLFSYSGETPEMVRLARQLAQLQCKSIAITRCRTSSLAKIVDAPLSVGDLEEACHLGLAPTSSTTVMLAIGDALALSVARHNGFQEQDFARNHPAGALGLKFCHVDSAMRTGKRLVCVSPGTLVRQVVELVSAAKTGAAVLINEDKTLYGIFTDGDLRRALLQGGSVLDQPVCPFSSHPCHSVSSGTTLAEALNVFTQTRTEDLPVVDYGDGMVVGLLSLKDITIS